MLFAFPFALLALLALPALAAIYLLRNRFRSHPVSSLMLWEDQRKARQGGLYIQRIQTPLLFLLELLTLAALAFAAAGPLLRSKTDRSSLVVVLDNSFSMLAGTQQTPRDRAITAIRRTLRGSGRFQVRFILAGPSPRFLGDTANTVPEAMAVLDQWQCREPAADLERALALAADFAGSAGRILVVTDHPPPIEVDSGRLVWRAFGTPLDNVAFVNANRTAFDGRDRVFLAVANLSAAPREAAVVLESLDPLRELTGHRIRLDAGEIHRMVLEPVGLAGPLRARLEDDSLAFDNEVVLLPESSPAARFALSVEDERLRLAVAQALEASQMATLSAVEPHILISDAARLAARPDEWTMRIVSEPNAAGHIGPFVLDRSHPLTDGLSLDGVIWGAAPAASPAGFAVISAGSVPLLSDRRAADGSHHILMNLNPDLSTLLRSPNWPALFWNLTRWRRSQLPGPLESNIPMGASAVFRLPRGQTSAVLTDPAGRRHNAAVFQNTVSLQPDLPGIYTLRTDAYAWQIAVNPLSMQESDLRRAETGVWGQWHHAQLFWWEYRPLAWVLLLFCLLLLTVHRLITASPGGADV